jgi:hypothetical protein
MCREFRPIFFPYRGWKFITPVEISPQTELPNKTKKISMNRSVQESTSRISAVNLVIQVKSDVASVFPHKDDSRVYIELSNK